MNGAADCAEAGWRLSAPQLKRTLTAAAAAILEDRAGIALGVSFDAISADADAQRKDGHTVMFVAIDGRPAGLIGVADPIKASTAEAFRRALRKFVTGAKRKRRRK